MDTYGNNSRNNITLYLCSTFSYVESQPKVLFFFSTVYVRLRCLFTCLCVCARACVSVCGRVIYCVGVIYGLWRCQTPARVLSGEHMGRQLLPSWGSGQIN